MNILIELVWDHQEVDWSHRSKNSMKSWESPVRKNQTKHLLSCSKNKSIKSTKLKLESENKESKPIVPFHSNFAVEFPINTEEQWTYETSQVINLQKQIEQPEVTKLRSFQHRRTKRYKKRSKDLRFCTWEHRNKSKQAKGVVLKRRRHHQ